MSVSVKSSKLINDLKDLFLYSTFVNDIKKGIRSLISHKMSMSERRLFNDVLLRSLIKHNNFELFKSTLKTVGYNLKSYSISSSFLFIVEYRDIEWIQTFMNFYDSTQYMYGDALTVSTKYGDLEKIKFFLNKVKIKNLRKNKMLVNQLTRTAADLDQTQILKYFIENKIATDLNYISNVILTHAVKHHSIDTIRYILSIPNIDLSNSLALYESVRWLTFSITKEIFKHPTAKHNNFLYQTFNNLVQYASNKYEFLAIEMYNAIQDKRIIDELNILLNNAILRKMHKLVDIFLSEKIFLLYLSRLDFNVMNNHIKIALKNKYDLKSDEELLNFLILL
jgi:hypothetical protein